MAEWKYKSVNGYKLRELIQTGDESETNCEAILKHLIKCYQEIQKCMKMDEYWFDNEVDELQDDIDCAAFDTETVNFHLSNFYDTCDQLRVWVSI